MSLINQMLKDLDARRSEATGAGTFGQQVRPVPERHRAHRAWWVVLVLGVLLIGVLAWTLFRPAPGAVLAQADGRIRLPLKFENQLSEGRVPVQMNPAAVQEPAPAVAISGTPTTLVTRQTEADSQDGSHQHDAGQSVARAVSQPVATEKAAARTLPPAGPLAVPAARPEKPTAAAPGVKAPEPAAPSTINKQVKELTPQQQAENEYRKAVSLIRQGRATDAISGLEQALQLDPHHGAARQTLVGVLLESKRLDDAVREAREGLDLDHAHPGLAMILARLQLEKGDLRPAIETLRRTLPYAGDKPDYQSFLAALLQRDGRNKDAAEHYLLALQKAPQNGVWWMGLGISLQAENRLPEAQEAFGRAKSSNSLSPELLAFVESRLKQLQR